MKVIEKGNKQYLMWEAEDVGKPEEKLMVGEYIADTKGRMLEVLFVTTGKGCVWADTVLGKFLVRFNGNKVGINFDRPHSVYAPVYVWGHKERAFMQAVEAGDSMLSAYKKVYGEHGQYKMWNKIRKILSHHESKKYMARIAELLKEKGVNEEFVVSKMLESIEGPIEKDLQFEILKLLGSAVSPETKQLLGVQEQSVGVLLPVGRVENAEFTEVTNQPVQQLKV